MLDPVAVTALSRPAVDCKKQGIGLGAQLTAGRDHPRGGHRRDRRCTGVLVHRLHKQVRALYAHFDFELLTDNPLHLLLLIKDADPSQR